MARIGEIKKKYYTLYMDYKDSDNDSEELSGCTEEQVVNIINNFKDEKNIFEFKEDGIWTVLRKEDVLRIRAEEEESDEDEDEEE